MPRRSPRPVLAACAVLLVAAAIAPVEADRGYYGRAEVNRGEPTTAGNWNGSWIYVSRDQHWALWLREGDKGTVDVKLQYQGQGTPETFETDWTGTAEYYLAGTPVRFQLKLTKAGADRLEGTWDWKAVFPDSERTETATVSLQRVANGRSLVLDFGENYLRLVRRGGKESRVTTPTVWGFTKVSKRHVVWDEMPW